MKLNLSRVISSKETSLSRSDFHHPWSSSTKWHNITDDLLHLVVCALHMFILFPSSPITNKGCLGAMMLIVQNRINDQIEGDIYKYMSECITFYTWDAYVHSVSSNNVMNCKNRKSLTQIQCIFADNGSNLIMLNSTVLLLIQISRRYVLTHTEVTFAFSSFVVYSRQFLLKCLLYGT